jgi:hypothetical protein
VSGDEDLLGSYVEANEITLDMLAVNHNGISMPIDPPSKRKHQTVKSRLQGHPNPCPQHKGLAS